MTRVDALTRGWRSPIVASWRELGACSVAGMIAGFLVGGLGSRVAMRISGIAAGASQQGVHTDAGFRVGEITLAGTIGLLVAGVFIGAIGGLFYAAVRPWLGGLGRWRGVAFGLFLLGMVGSLVLDPNNFDFGRFGPVWLNVGMFAGLFVLFGAVIDPVAARIERDVPGSSFEVLLWLAALPPLLFAVLGVVQLLGELVGVQSSLGSGTWSFAFLVLAVALRAYFARGGARFERPSDLPWRDRVVGFALLALPLAGATWLTLKGIDLIVRMAI